MDKVILLKTQLAEAAKFGKSNDFRYQRLAVILLDNFVEIQLNSLIKQKFRFDTELSKYQQKKYSEKIRKKALSYYDELLKVCQLENIISEEERYLLDFCHNIRNNLYHSITEEELLVTIALRTLKDIISLRQPIWKNTKPFTTYNYKIDDPYNPKKHKGKFGMSGNDEKEWNLFLKEHFDFIDRRKASSSSLLSKFILNKTYEIRENFKFIFEEYPSFYPFAESWSFNEYIYNYSFKILNYQKLEEIKEIENFEEKQIQNKVLLEDFKKNWREKKISRIKAIEEKAKSISKLNIAKALEVYISLRDEIYLIHNAITKATSDLDFEIDMAIQRNREVE